MRVFRQLHGLPQSAPAGRRRTTGTSLLELFVAMALSLVVIGLMISFLIPTLRASTKGQIRAEMAQQAMLALAKISEDLLQSSPGGVSLNNTEFSACAPKSGPLGTVLPVTNHQVYPVTLAVQRVNYQDANGDQEWVGKLQVYQWNPGSASQYMQGVPMKFPGAVTAQVGNLITYPTTSGVVFPCGSNAPYTADAPTKLTCAQLTGTSWASPPTILANGVTNFVVMVGNPLKTICAPTCNQPIVNSPITVYLQLARIGATGGVYPELQSFSKTVSMRNQSK